MKAKVFRYYEFEGSKKWDVVVYWTHDPEKYPQDYDLYMTSAEWRKFSGLPAPQKGFGSVVEIRTELIGNIPEPWDRYEDD